MKDSLQKISPNKMKNRVTIFLVDDQKIANFITKKVIETSRIECDILAFEEPAKALEALQKKCPEYIFLDLNMPVIDGWQFLEKIKGKINSKVIILTSSVDPADEEKAKQFSQVISYQTKPPSKQIIADIIKGKEH